MSDFVSADGRWQWNGRRWKRVDPGWKTDQIEYINESYLNSGEEVTQPLIEEAIELDEIELNTAADEVISESAPLLPETIGLAEAGGIAGSTSASSVVPALVGTVGGAIVIGGGIGIATAVNKNKEDKHIDPVVSLPGHKYIGPGNSIDSAEPVDTDDLIAEAHDKAYENSKTQEDIQKADHESANDFLTDIIENQNPHSIAGYIGLKTKETVENIVGVQYPPNLPSVSGMAPTRSKYPIHRDPSKHPEFPTDRNQRRYAWDAWNRARQNHGLPRVDPPYSYDIPVTPRPPKKADGSRPTSDSISYRQWRDEQRGVRGPLVDGFNRQNEQQVARNDHLLNTVVWDELTAEEEADLNDIFNQIENPVTERDSVEPVAGPSGTSGTSGTEMNTRGQKRAHDGPQGGNAAPTTTTPAPAAANTDGTGHNSGSDGGFDSAQGPVSILPKGGYKSVGGMQSFTKVHRMKSWAIPYTNVTSADRSGANMVVTPLAKIPWEYAFFYLSPEEFKLLPAGSYIHSVSIEIMQTVCQTGYPTGGSTSTVATTNHPKVLLIGKDLEAKSRGGLDKKIQINDKMIPTFPTDSSPLTDYDVFIKNQYGTDQSVADSEVVLPGVAYKIPYYNQVHYCVYQPNRAQAKARNFFVENTDTPPVITENNCPGHEYFQNYITEINSNDTTWDYVDSMTYKFESAPIGEQFPHLEILATNTKQSVGNAQYYNVKRNITNTNPKGNITFTETIVPSQRNNIPIVTYKSAPIEKGSYFVKGDSAHKPARQPTFHIGVRAIDKSDPALNIQRVADFVQANIEFEIKATMNITLPQYPNRFILPKFYNTSIENAVQGLDAYPAFNPAERFVTFGLYNESPTAPAVSAVDATGQDENEDGAIVNTGRPRRAIPRVPVMASKLRRRK